MASQELRVCVTRLEIREFLVRNQDVKSKISKPTKEEGKPKTGSRGEEVAAKRRK